MSPIKKIILIAISVGLMGCSQKTTYSYLIEHPTELKNQFDACQSLEQKSPDQVTQCEEVTRAAAYVSAVINEQQQNPEAFGQKVLDIEAANVKLEKAVEEAQQNIAALKAKQASASELQSAQQALASAESQLNTQRQQLKVMLAVIGLGSPE